MNDRPTLFRRLRREFRRVRDANEAARREAADTQANLAAVMESTPDMIWSVEVEHFNLKTFNSAFAAFVRKIAGVDLRAGMSSHGNLPPNLAELWRSWYRRAIEEGPFRVEHRLNRFDRLLELSFNRIVESGKTTAVAVFAKDITDRWLAESALSRSEVQYRRLFEAAGDAIIVTRNTVGIDCNEQATRLYRCQRQDLIGATPKHFSPERQPDGQNSGELARQKTRAAESGTPQFFRWTCRRKDGTLFDAEISLGRLGDGEHPSLMAIIRDVSEREKTRAALSDTQAILRAAIEQTPAGVVIGVPPDGSFRIYNSAALAMLGRETAAPSPMSGWDLLQTDGASVPVDQRPMLMAIREGKTLRGEEMMIRREGGGQIWILVNSAPVRDAAGRIIAGVVVLTDITARRNAEALVLQSEKLRTVAALAAGVAHEINNPLAGMVQNAQALLHRLTENLPANLKTASALGIPFLAVQEFARRREILSMLEAIRSSGGRASRIVRNLLSYARDDTEAQSVTLGGLVDEALELAQNDYELHSGAATVAPRIQRRFAPDAPRVLCHPAQIHQVLLNLMRNAFQAMRQNPPDRPPTLVFTVGAGDVGHSVDTGEPAGGRASGGWIEVADNGPGLTQNARDRMFEPFFTTKPAGQGTGLGLFVCYQLITVSHRGRLTLESTPGQGTTFKIWLPVGPPARAESA
jgi:PAS domain S-box-containing protein